MVDKVERTDDDHIKLMAMELVRDIVAEHVTPEKITAARRLAVTETPEALATRIQETAVAMTGKVITAAFEYVERTSKARAA